MPASPALRTATLARIAPFAFFIVVLAVRGELPTDVGLDTRWIYAVAVIGVGALLAWWWREYGELAAQNRPTGRELALALAVGGVVFWAWINLDAPWMRIGEPSAEFRPVDAAGNLDRPLIVFRVAGAALVVPVMEELFWRSFLMRWLHAAPFEGVDPRRVGPRAVVMSTFVFMLAHTQWLAAIVAGLAYAWLYIRCGKLWVAVIAHAVTNSALAAWVVHGAHWQFW